MFNTFLEDLKEQLRNKASFWARIKEGTLYKTCLYFQTCTVQYHELFVNRCIVKLLMCLEKVTLISKDECGDVDVSEETARSVNYVILYIYFLQLAETNLQLHSSEARELG
jgi:hypothetical protein